MSPSFLQRRTINLYKTKQQSRAATVYPRVAKTTESVTIQPTREMCINQLQRALRKRLFDRGRGGAIRLRIAARVPLLDRCADYTPATEVRWSPIDLMESVPLNHLSAVARRAKEDQLSTGATEGFLLSCSPCWEDLFSTTRRSFRTRCLRIALRVHRQYGSSQPPGRSPIDWRRDHEK